MKSKIMTILQRARLVIVLAISLVVYQNCADVHFSGDDALTSIKVCNGVSCDLDPLTPQAAVTTILLALGDEANNQLVIGGGSAQLMAETAIRISSPVVNPKILILQDYDSASEHPYDLTYISTVLLQRYDTTTMTSPKDGITAADVDGYDLIWFNNPGAPWRVKANRDALLAFKGGIILEGDDLSWGLSNAFSLDELTGLTFVDNGSQITCGGKKYNTDNNAGTQFRVKIAGLEFTGAGVTADLLQFNYGNDIDLTVVARPDLQILATAKGSPNDCTEERPTIVRYVR